MIGIGVVTFNRPDCLRRSLGSVFDHLSSVVDLIYVNNDGSSREHRAAYQDVYASHPGFVLQDCYTNWGVAHAKNSLLSAMFVDGADTMFLLEDDIEVIDRKAITGYISACEQSGWQHLSFAHHGQWNLPPLEVDGPVSLYWQYVGAFSVYSRQSIAECGMFDENFRNAYEHVEHTLRLGLAGYTDPRPFHAADATGSENWLREISAPSPLREDPDWEKNILASREYWKRAKSETYDMIFSHPLYDKPPVR